jgi:hypothetical protein
MQYRSMLRHRHWQLYLLDPCTGEGIPRYEQRAIDALTGYMHRQQWILSLLLYLRRWGRAYSAPTWWCGNSIAAYSSAFFLMLETFLRKAPVVEQNVASARKKSRASRACLLKWICHVCSLLEWLYSMVCDELSIIILQKVCTWLLTCRFSVDFTDHRTWHTERCLLSCPVSGCWWLRTVPVMGAISCSWLKSCLGEMKTSCGAKIMSAFYFESFSPEISECARWLVMLMNVSGFNSKVFGRMFDWSLVIPS